MNGSTSRLVMVGALLVALRCAGQAPTSQPEPSPTELTRTGQILVAGRSTPYLIRHLPISSFPAIPASLQRQLDQRGCAIPQTYQAHGPENVIHASFEGPGSSDWAVLCAAGGTVSLLIYFASAPGDLAVLATARETDRLQAHDASGVLGFNWGIDPASPEQVHQAQMGMERSPARVDHDALADSKIDGRTLYRFFAKGRWKLLDAAD